MKPAPFAYHDPADLHEALKLLAEHGDEAKALAGGQSLVPMMNFRLARPTHVVDLNHLEELRGLRTEAGELRIAAMTRQRELETSPIVATEWPLLTGVLPYVSHVQIRNRGTVGGSLAHADPAAELPAAMLVLGAQLVVRRRDGEREEEADGFFRDAYTTSLEPDELLAEIRIPGLAPRTGWGFQEVSRRHGDFALVAAAALVTLDESGAIREARLAVAGAGPRAVRAPSVESALAGQRPDSERMREAAALVTEHIDPHSDVSASADYRRQVATVVARRALEEAVARAEAIAA
jgi:CO/xanthine dehydrogenase FAD-binding subunit